MNDVWQRERSRVEYTEKPLETDHCIQSIAISMKRIADVLEDAFGTSTREEARREFREVMSQIEMSVRR